MTDAHTTAGTADEHLRGADPVLARIIDAQGPLPEPAERPDHYGALVRAIVGQQLSTKAAHAIHQRLLDLFEGRPPTPDELLGFDPEPLRSAAGLSRAKVTFLRSLAEHVISGELELDRVAELPDEDVVAELTAVKGVGVWTAHMFLMFQLGRPDVLPVGDLGIRRAVERAYRLRDLPSAGELEALAEPWRPHRTAACLHLWRSLDNLPE